MTRGLQKLLITQGILALWVLSAAIGAQDAATFDPVGTAHITRVPGSIH
jgi:hypothetical protein